MTNEIGCSLLFGDGSVEFRPASFVNVQRGRETPLGRITYRGGGDRVVGLQQDGARAFLQFDFVSPDRIALSGAPCAMDRVVAAIQVAAQATAPPASRATAVGSGAAFEVLGVTLGRSSVDEVRNNIHARRGRPLIGRVPGTQELRIQVHDRAYGDPRLANVWYDFTDGVLSSVTIIWAREPGTPTLFNERATSLNQRFGPPQSKTASSLQGSMTGASFDLVDEPAHGRVIERYAIAR
jgi:hypothetical protein